MVVVRDLQLLGVNGVEAVLLLSCALLPRAVRTARAQNSKAFATEGTLDRDLRTDVAGASLGKPVNQPHPWPRAVRHARL